MVINILENVTYVPPITGLPIPDGMCKECASSTPVPLPLSAYPIPGNILPPPPIITIMQEFSS
jgi:hypothetical protein